MHQPLGRTWWVAVLGVACCCGAPPLHAASSSQTVGVVIVMPERTDRADAEAAGSLADSLLEEPFQPPADRGMVRTTTIVPGDGGRRLVTDVPEL